ncbi:MAG: hypothetical protein R6T96_10040, partial [Longimicrobiales bacterium]
VLFEHPFSVITLQVIVFPPNFASAGSNINPSAAFPVTPGPEKRAPSAFACSRTGRLFWQKVDSSGEVITGSGTDSTKNVSLR